MNRLLLTQGVVLLALFFFTGCASSGKNLQPQINTLVIADHLEGATRLLNEGPTVYGANNELLYWLDRGMAYHLKGDYQESINALAHARRLVDVFYGRSVGEIASSWLVNDRMQQYRAEEHEVVLINIFQAINYALLGKIDESLVEARDVNKQLSLIGSRHPEGLTHVYKDDACAWLLMGLLWEIEGSSASLQDAAIAYQRAKDVYSNDYMSNYGIKAPSFLDDNLSRVKKLNDGERVKVTDGEIYVIQYAGFSPTKVAKSYILPLGFTKLTKVSFPNYEDRFSEFDHATVTVSQGGVAHVMPTDIIQPIGMMAKQILKNRIAWITTKGVLRPGMKLLFEHVVEEQVRQHYGDWQAEAVAVLGSIYNLSSEEADTRSWQTIPNQIRIARIVVPAGQWEVKVDNYRVTGQLLAQKTLGVVDIKAGEKKILLTRSVD